MSVEVYRLNNTDGEQFAAILVCNTSGRPLNLPVSTFEDEDEAESFLQWCHREPGVGDPRKMSASELEAAVEGWREWNTVAP